MKKILFYCALAAGVTFAADGCGDQKQEKPQTDKRSEAVRPDPNRITLETALKQKFGVKFGWDAGKKCFITIAEVRGKQNPGANYSMTFLHDGQIKRPDFLYELQGAVLALGEFAEFLQTSLSEEKGLTVTRSSVTFGKLKADVEKRFDSKTDQSTRSIKVTSGDERLLYLDDAGLQHSLKAEDINLFKALMASNGLEFTLLGWSQEAGTIRMAFSLRQLSTWKEKVMTSSGAQLEYTKKEVRTKVKKGMKKLSEKLDEWSEEELE